MKKTLVLISFFALCASAKAKVLLDVDNSIIYIDTLAPITATKLILKNSTLKDGLLIDENGLVLGQAKDEQKSKADARGHENKPYKIEQCETTTDGRVIANGVLLGVALKKE